MEYEHKAEDTDGVGAEGDGEKGCGEYGGIVDASGGKVNCAVIL